MSNPFETTQKQRHIAIAGLVALKVAILFVLAWNTRFVMDEFVQLGWAQYLGNGAFDRLWPAKAVGFAVFYKLAHLAGWDATSTLLIGRMQTALLACGTLAIVYGCARALGESRLRALAVLLVLLSFSNFIERIFRTIAEPLAVFFAVAALLVVLRGQSDRARTIIIAGVLSGLSFLATQKAVYFNVALGLALVMDAALARQYAGAIKRGAWLVLGWLVAIAAYCFIFGGTDPMPVARHLFLGPVAVATTGGDVYGSLRYYVGQTLQRNFILYIFCFSGMALTLLRIRSLDGPRRIALVFSIVVTAFVFAHNQPWPYVFIMALPFMALWAPVLLDRVAVNPLHLRLAWIALAIAIATSFVRNGLYLRHDNRDQLRLVASAESLLGPVDGYFDAIGMLPNKSELSPLWLDRLGVVTTLAQGQESETYRALTETPPKVILWSYRLDAVEPVIGPAIRDRYVRIAPNLRIAGRRLRAGVPTPFDVPVAATYRLYDLSGAPAPGTILVDGIAAGQSVRLAPGPTTVTLRAGPGAALLLPEGRYEGVVRPGPDNKRLFAGVYN